MCVNSKGRNTKFDLYEKLTVKCTGLKEPT